MKYLILPILAAVAFTGCQYNETAASKESKAVNRQQSQYAKGQPIPAFNWSLERDQVIKLYKLRNAKVSTHAVWRSQMGQIEGDCSSIGFGIPYDVSLTNPTQLSSSNINTVAGYRRVDGVIGQAEPNGVFASTNTAATWVMCVGPGGTIEPHYIEATLNVYPYEVKVDYTHNRVHRTGTKSVTLK